MNGCMKEDAERKMLKQVQMPKQVRHDIRTVF